MYRAWHIIAVPSAVLVVALGGSPAAYGQDFFSQLFRGFNRQIERPFVRMPFVVEQPDDGVRRADSDTLRYGRGQAYCVRTCDGRYFPLAGVGEGKAAACSSLCPASETQVYYGNSIDDASAENGRRYGDLPNAFKYRLQLVAHCTCNGNPTGLAPVSVENDSTLKRGDIIAGADGLLVSSVKEKRGASLDFSPASDAIRLQFSGPRRSEAD